tara:strand:+ start:150 stop:455 length:306 start_codon:yes stop_codon:yes gene_type:complete
MTIYVDIDNTICRSYKNKYDEWDYSLSKPRFTQIAKINKLFEDGNKIVYWTARGSLTGINWYDLTKSQLDSWNCKYHEISVGEKPPYDLLICDKTKRIEEL